MAYSSNISVVANGTKSVKVDDAIYPLNTLGIQIRNDKLIRIFRVADGKEITDLCNYAEYKDTSNVPYTTFALAITGISALIFA